MSNPLTITATGDRTVAMRRALDAPRHLVWEAYTKPELLKRWLGVFGGWSLAVCEIDLRVGGRYRWVWRNGDIEMGAGGVYLEIARPERLVVTERFDDPWYPGEAVGTTEFVEQGGKTLVTITMRYESREARDAVLASPMETGLQAGFAMLEEVLASLAADGRA
jgi:uncharacterized protein YndB with AHSA1/START domain